MSPVSGGSGNGVSSRGPALAGATRRVGVASAFAGGGGGKAGVVVAAGAVSVAAAAGGTAGTTDEGRAGGSLRAHAEQCVASSWFSAAQNGQKRIAQSP